MSPKHAASADRTSDPDRARASVDLEPEREGYLAARWLRPDGLGPATGGDWASEGDMIRARLIRRYRRFIGELAPDTTRRE